MNTEKVQGDKEEFFKIVNEDWPMLEELGKKRFVINKKKDKDIQESLYVLQSVLEEENTLSENHEKYFSGIFESKNKKIEITIPATEIEDKVVLKQEVLKHSTAQGKTIIESKITKKIEQPILPKESEIYETPVANSKVEVLNKKDKVIEEKPMDLFKSILSGLSYLYVSKTSQLLKPIKFVVDNYQKISIAMIHFFVPLIMTYLITTQVSFVSIQLLKETNLMKAVYMIVFFFGLTFLWISTQVIFLGIYSMITKSILDVAKIGKQNKEI